mmetsp:Transcript_48844/g.138054  ORF Transcript_48844/g.138054 Transcript_48844/m.138054 type:complete len:157 (+) Transcript_48844:88-558(+)
MSSMGEEAECAKTRRTARKVSWAPSVLESVNMEPSKLGKLSKPAKQQRGDEILATQTVASFLMTLLGEYRGALADVPGAEVEAPAVRDDVVVSPHRQGSCRSPTGTDSAAEGLKPLTVSIAWAAAPEPDAAIPCDDELDPTEPKGASRRRRKIRQP